MELNPAIAVLHEKMGIKYPMPYLDGPLVLIKEHAFDDRGNIVAACAVKLTSEAYLWLDPEASVRNRIQGIREVSEHAVLAARAANLEDVSAWIPPHIEPRFAHLLIALGWRKSPWPSWSRLL